jgi:hypothetical protein
MRQVFAERSGWAAAGMEHGIELSKVRDVPAVAKKGRGRR